jgi:hypothetical protein
LSIGKNNEKFLIQEGCPIKYIENFSRNKKMDSFSDDCSVDNI